MSFLSEYVSLALYGDCDFKKMEKKQQLWCREVLLLLLARLVCVFAVSASLVVTIAVEISEECLDSAS